MTILEQQLDQVIHEKESEGEKQENQKEEEKEGAQREARESEEIKDTDRVPVNKYLIDPIDKKSRPVEDTKNDMMLIEIDGYYMYKSLSEPHGFHIRGAYAIAHSQVNSSDPLRFFVTREEIIVNPKIIRHTNYKHRKTEGCMSFPFTESLAPTQRYNKMTVEYQTVEERGGEMHLSEIKTRELHGLEAQIWQHEIDHFNCKYIYRII